MLKTFNDSVFLWIYLYINEQQSKENIIKG